MLLALVDTKYRFIWTSLGPPGNLHDSTYFQSTSLWDEINAGKVLQWMEMKHHQLFWAILRSP